MKEIVYTVKVKQDDGTEKEMKKVAKSTNDYAEAIKQLNDKLDDTDLGSKQYQKVQKDLKNAQKTFDKTKMKAQGFTKSLKEAPGALGSVGKSVEGLGTGFKALLANPVALFFTLIVGALTAIVKAFKSTKEGAEFFDQASAALGATMDVLRDILVTVGKKLVSIFTDPKQALMDFWTALKQNVINRLEGLLEFIPAIGKAIGLVFKGEWSEAAKVATDATAKVALGVEDFTDKVVEVGQSVKKVFEEVKKEASDAAALTATLQKLDDRQRSLNERRAEQNKLLAQAKERINDENLSYEERITALQEVGEAEQKLLDDELALQRQRLAAKEALAAQSDSDKATLDELSNLRIQLDNLELASSQKKKEIFDQEKALRDREKAEKEAKVAQDKADADKAIEDRKKVLDAEIALQMMADEKDIELLKEKLQARLEVELENLELSEEEKNLIKAEYAEREKELDDEVAANAQENADKKIAAKQRELQALAGGLGQLSDVLGKETKAGKAAATASALINTYLGASQVISDKTLPTLAKFVSVAAIIGTGLKTVASINKTKTDVPKYAEGGLIEGQGTGTSDGILARLSNGESVINAQSTAQFSGLLSSINEAGGGRPIGNGGGSNSSPVIKTYVVASEVQSQAQMDRVIKSRSKI